MEIPSAGVSSNCVKFRKTVDFLFENIRRKKLKLRLTV